MATQHNDYYLPTGDLVLQVEDVLFKVHRHFLIQDSSVFRDMLNVPPEEGRPASEQRPIILQGDSVQRTPNLSTEEMVAVLQVAHKYCMDKLQKDIVDFMTDSGYGTPQLVHLLVAARLIDDQELEKLALTRLHAIRSPPTLEEARMIGIEGMHSILEAHLSSFPRCPTCTTPLAIDRDVVQVFGRPKVIPSDAPWTSVNHTPGSRGSTADPSVYEKKTLNAANQLSPSSEGKENYDFSAPPPPASPIPIDTRAPQSRPSRLETSRTSSFDQFHKRRPLQPLSLIQRPNSCGSSSQENLHNPKPPVSLFVTNASSGSSSSLDINGKEAMEDNAWSAWRRASDTTTLVPTRRPSQFTRRMTDSPTPGDGLRPPSPQLRTKAFRPGWANARRNKLQKENNASTDSLDNDMRRSMEVRFTRGLSFDDSDAANGEDGSDVDRDSIYLHSPPKKTKPLGVPSSSLLFSNDEIHKPVARYAFDQPNAQSQRSPTGQHFVAGQRTNQNQWYTMNNQQHSHSVAQPSSKRTEMVPPSNFARLKAAVAEEQEKDSFLTDPLGRAMCVFAVVILVKILLK
ncbi:hypothetical protein FRC20_010659 [Serendipita sp. 405]|nr:hypothetical protein FRC20_010659 [Serendipita sp. 405]